MMKFADAAFLLMEKPKRGSQVSMLSTWTLPKDAKENYLSEMVEHWRGRKAFAEPFNLRIKAGRLPGWEALDPEQIDMDDHLFHYHLPHPGGERELGILASRLHSQALDRSRPLWEMHVIGGLEGNRFALLLKLHHAQIDGMGIVGLVERVLSSSAKTRNMPAFWEVPPKPAPKKPGGKQRATFIDYAKLAREFLRMKFGQHPDSAAPFDAPMTSLNGQLGLNRRIATQLYDMKRLTRLADKAEVTVNDVALSICAGALRRYLSDHDQLPSKTLTAGVPVSVRVGDGVGNAVSFMIAKLHTGVEDPLERLQAIRRSTTLAKQRFGALDSKTTREAFGTLIMGPYLAQVITNLAGRSTPVYNLIISNVPGPREHRYLNGARMEAIYPISITMEGQALNVTFVSYAGSCTVGFTACREGVPHMQHIAVATGEELEKLEQALGLGACARRRTPSRSASAA